MTVDFGPQVDLGIWVSRKYSQMGGRCCHMTQKRESQMNLLLFCHWLYYFLLIFCGRGLRPFQVSNISTALTRTIRINGLVCQTASLVN